MSTNNNKLGLAVIASIVLHLLLIGLLLLGSFFTNMIQPAAGGSGGESDTLDAVMVDTAQVAKEYQRFAQQQNTLSNKPEPRQQQETLKTPTEDQPTQEKVEKALVLEQQKKQEEQKRAEEQRRQQELLKKQEESRKKVAEAARLKAETEAKRLEAAAKQAEEARKAEEAEKQRQLEKHKRQAAEEKAKAEKEAKLQAEKAAKAKAEKEARLKAEREAKAKAEAEAKAKAEQQAKNSKTLDDFLNGGAINSPHQGGNQNKQGSQGKGNAKSIGDGIGNEDRGYENLIKKKLMRFYRVEDNFRGRECRIKLFIERNGQISNYQVLSGPDDICRAATSAIIAAKEVPPAPSDELYTRYKSPIMQFSLKIQ